MTTEFTFTITFENGMRGVKVNSLRKEQNVQNYKTITKDKSEQLKIGNMNK